MRTELRTTTDATDHSLGCRLYLAEAVALGHLEVAIDSGERIGLLGRNGTGKSTLMKIIAGDLQPDHGEVRRSPRIKVARLVQEVPSTELGTIRKVVEEGLKSEEKTSENESASLHHESHDRWKTSGGR